MKHRSTISLAALLLLFFAATALWLRDPGPGDEEQQRLSVAETLGANETEGFARALQARPFSFPGDHGPHPEFKTEWWYFTGNLTSTGGRTFGFQLTFFRIALSPEPRAGQSAWGSHQVYMAHFALSDIAGRRFYDFERFSRAALGLAGAQAEPFRVWLEDWSAAGEGGEPFSVALRAVEADVTIDLRLQSAKPVVLQGDRGLSRKSAKPGNASYYYSLTRLLTEGQVRVGDETFAVKGLSWLDREWSTSSLAEDQVGWDWFALQLGDGRELMFYQLRNRDGRADALSSGTLVEADGDSRKLTLAEVQIEPLETWRSPRSGAEYPARWHIVVPAAGVDLEVVPLLDDQELQASVRYWEGAVSAEGRSQGRKVEGRGYVELTGYGPSQR